MATLDEFEHYIHQAIPAYTEKEEIGMLKSEIETLKEENSKLRPWYVWGRNINKTSDGNIKQRKRLTKVENRNQTNVKTSILSKYTIRHEKQICSTSKHSGWSVRQRSEEL